MHDIHEINNILSDIEKRYNVGKDTNRNFILGISGIDCSGKSTLSEVLYDKLKDKEINAYLIHGDDFLFNKKIRNANVDQEIAYYYETFNYKKLFNEIIIPAKKNRYFYQEVEMLDWKTDLTFIGDFEFKGPCIIIIEGVLLYKKEYKDIFDYKVWIDIDFDTGIERALKRKRDIEYYKDKDELLNRYLGRFYKGQALHMRVDNPKNDCDYIIGHK
jgi:uridine kinase